MSQEVELRCREGDLRLTGEGLPLVGEATDGPTDQGRRTAVDQPGGPSQDAADPGDDLPRREGLSDVVVRPELQADDPVHLVVARGDEEDRDPVALGAQDAADLYAVHPR